MHHIKTLAQVILIVKYCNNKFDCLIFELLYIKHLQPDLNTQSDSIKTKLFT